MESGEEIIPATSDCCCYFLPAINPTATPHPCFGNRLWIHSVTDLATPLTAHPSIPLGGLRRCVQNFPHPRGAEFVPR